MLVVLSAHKNKPILGHSTLMTSNGQELGKTFVAKGSEQEKISTHKYSTFIHDARDEKHTFLALFVSSLPSAS